MRASKGPELSRPAAPAKRKRAIGQPRQFEFSVKDRETVNIPSWAGGGALALGLVLLAVRTKR